MTDGLFNVVLDSSHVLEIEGIECITLGHGFTGDVVGHDYFGTNRVLDDLRSLPGWDEGTVTVRGFIRDVKTKLVTGIL